MYSFCLSVCICIIVSKKKNLEIFPLKKLNSLGYLEMLSFKGSIKIPSQTHLALVGVFFLGGGAVGGWRKEARAVFNTSTNF